MHFKTGPELGPYVQPSTLVIEIILRIQQQVQSRLGRQDDALF
jgi:hypothetical protein